MTPPITPIGLGHDKTQAAQYRSDSTVSAIKAHFSTYQAVTYSHRCITVSAVFWWNF